MRQSILDTPPAKALVLGVVYYVSVVVGAGLVLPESKIALFWPANAFAAVALLFSSRRHWPLYLSVMAVAHLSGIIPTGHFPLHVSLGFCAANIGEVLVLVVLVRACVGSSLSRDNLTRYITAVMLCAVPATLVGAMMGTAFAYLNLPEVAFLNLAASWFSAGLTGLILVLPLLLAWLTPVVVPQSPLKRTEYLELFGIIIAIAVVSLYFLTSLTDLPHLSHAANFLVFPLLIWSAIRLGLRSAVTAVTCMGLLVIVLVYYGYGPFNIDGMSAATEVVFMHGGLITVAFAVIFLAVVVTEHRQTELALTESEARFRSLFEHANVMIWGTYDDGKICVFNREAERVLGYTKEEALALDNLELHPPEERDEIAEKFAAHREGIEDTDMEFGLYTKYGKRLVGNAAQGSFKDSSGQMFYFVMVKDVTLNKQAEMRVAVEKKKYEDAIEGINSGLVLLDAKTKIVWANGVFQRWFGSFEGLEGRECCDVYGMENPGKECVALHACSSGEAETGEYSAVTADGVQRCFQITVSPVFDECEQLVQLVELVQDISERKLDEEKLRQSQARMDHLAHHDQLTGLPNRLLLGARFKLSLEQAKRDNNSVGVLFIDLDGFKPVNDNYGHDVGDQVLKQIADRLGGCVRAEDTVARLGGDEFLVVMEKINDGRDAALLASKIQAELAPPVLAGEKQLSLSASIGICIHPQDGKDMDTLLHNADAAMYLAKQKGPGSYCFYADEYCSGANDRANMHAELRSALDRHEFVLSYKPQFDLAGGGLVAAEAQTCWQHPEKGLLQPQHFLPLADRLGLMSELNDWILRQACAQWVEWQASGLELGRIAVNLAESQVGDAHLASRIGTILHETGCPPEKLELEVTEIFVMRDMEADICALARLSELGVVIAIERFGKDYCSLRQLGQIPINKLKIDPALTRNILDNPGNQKVVGAIIALADSLHFKVIAEEIEDETQTAFLASIGCTQVQGMPMTVEDFFTDLVS